MHPSGVSSGYGSLVDPKHECVLLQVLWRVCNDSAYDWLQYETIARPIETFPIRKRDLSRVIKVGMEVTQDA